MLRWLVFCAVLLSLLGQTASFARGLSTSPVVGDAAHAALHWEHTAHHHHDDGSVHLDDSLASAQHLLSDHSNASTVLLPGTATQLPCTTSAVQPGFAPVPVPDPALDGPLKPPRLTR